MTTDDVAGLAELMLNAYVGTIDYDGESLEDAIEEVSAFFRNHNPLFSHSLTVEVGDRLGSAVLVSLQDDEPFIGYVMTWRDLKRTGLARVVSAASLGGLAAAGYKRAVFYITDGNRPSEALFSSLGAVEIAE